MEKENTEVLDVVDFMKRIEEDGFTEEELMEIYGMDIYEDIDAMEILNRLPRGGGK